ncbi:unnamed protein product [Miscanthus lutarioriparius]|uniref:DUF4220 domain-containing protein n=1 Tax=Miscanthus lutarioriparius TaxID=422564 RepID=A0A811SSG2_9POAL|nr:unnamed protein product [Miscanthus lutarioriparius]
MAGLSVYLMGAISDVLVDLRNEWAVQSLVLFSFSLQVFLLMFAWTRRKNVATLTRLLLWLAYQLADSTALFTLGHMAIRARSPDEQQLMAFWAPFLLVHLGGQDTITAYSFEDNGLWLRHLQTLVVQFLGAAYVLYKYIPGSERLIRVASILMFIVGGLKYGERIWALRSASMDSIWSSLDNDKSDTSARRSESRKILLELVDKRWNPLDDEDILMASHGLLDVCKGIFIGSQRERGGAADCIERVMWRCRQEHRLDMLMEMELSLMYDIMYTKAAVIHSWWGCCIRVISPVATAIAFLLFRITSKGGHKEKDVVITYVLLAGALLLETASLVRAAGSTWTAAFLHAKKWCHLYEFQDFRVFLRAASYRRWSGTVGQYSLLQSWGHDMAKPTGSRMAGRMGLERWWYQLCHSRSDQISGTTKELILKEIFEMGPDRRNVSSRPGFLALQQHHLHTEFGWSVEESDIEGSIIAWHVATDLYYRDADNKVEDMLQASLELSRYMMFLFVKAYTEAWDKEQGAKAITEKHRLDWVLRTFRKSFKKVPLSRQQVRFMDSFLPTEFPPAGDNPAVGGFVIAQELRNRPEGLKVIFGVWVEMLCFVANHCSRESHARQLSCGGELVTIAWLMAKHANLPAVAAATEYRRHTVPRCKYIRPWYPDHPGSN